MAEHEPGLDPLAEDARLTSLDQRLKQAKTDEAIRTGEARDQGQASYRLGNRVLAELSGRREEELVGRRLEEIGIDLGELPDAAFRDGISRSSADVAVVPARAAVPRDSGGVQEHHQDFQRALEVIFGRLS